LLGLLVSFLESLTAVSKALILLRLGVVFGSVSAINSSLLTLVVFVAYIAQEVSRYVHMYVFGLKKLE
jgi:hypothetical protein